MSVFVFKTFSIAVKNLARPVVSYFAYYNRVKLQESNNFLLKKIRDYLIKLGQNFHYYNTLFNRKMFKLQSKNPINPLTPDKALERGAELITEFIVYSIIIIIPSWEIIKSQARSKDKENKKLEELSNMRSELSEAIDGHHKLFNEIDDIKNAVSKLDEKIYNV